MAEEVKVARVHLERVKDFTFTARFPDLPADPVVTLDEAPPLGQSNGPNPAALLAAAVGNCLAASLVFCLKKARIEPTHIAADATARIVRNERGRFRIGGVEVDLAIDVPADQAAAFERCQGLFEDFCIVTESVRHGIPVEVRVSTGAAETIEPMRQSA
jgi:organic hydroperoxide reductase OsmC/OhrA